MNEETRLAALRACKVLDTQRETAFDNIVFTAAQVFRAPIAWLALIDAERVWLKAWVGPVEQEYGRSHTFCSTVVEFNQLMVVEDASVDPRFQSGNVIKAPVAARFMVGAPLRGPAAQPVGALCVVDRLPRTIADRQRMQLQQLAVEAGELLRLRVPGLDIDAG